MPVVSLTSNYFDLFGIPISFDLDQAVLAERFRRLQWAVHPDKYVSASDQERRLSMQQSIRVNEAYQALRDPLARAQYLLLLNKCEIKGETHMDPEFLMQQMRLRESLEHVQMSANPVDDLLAIGNEVDAIYGQLIRNLTELFAGGVSKNTKALKVDVQRLQFINKLKNEICALEEILC